MVRGACRGVKTPPPLAPEGMTVDEITVLELVAKAKRRKEVWVGESFWLWPSGPIDTREAVHKIATAVLESGKGILEPVGEWRIRITGRLRTLRGPMGQAMRHHLNRVGGGEVPAVAWSPAAGPEIWTLGGNDNG